MSTPMLFVRVVGEPYLSRCQKFHDDFQTAHKAYRAFSKKYGGIGYLYLGTHGLTSLTFEVGKGNTWVDDIPKGWTKPNYKNGASRPMKKNVEALAEMAALPKGPSSWEVYEGIPLDNNYTAEKGNISCTESLLNYAYEPYITWPVGFTMMFFMKIPNIEQIKRMTLLEHPDAVFSDEIANWKMPDSLIEVSEAEVDYEHAKAAMLVDKVEKEKADA